MIRLLAILCAAAVSGCATSTYHAAAHCGPPASDVRVVTVAPPAGSYTVCGSIYLEAGGIASDSTVFDSLKAEAGKRGANAILIVDDISGAFTIKYGYNRRGTVLAIKLK
jgi:hypothetical protein